MDFSRDTFYRYQAAVAAFAPEHIVLQKHVAVTGKVLIDAQVVALERKQDDDVTHGEIETAHSGNNIYGINKSTISAAPPTALYRRQAILPFVRSLIRISYPENCFFIIGASGNL